MIDAEWKQFLKDAPDDAAKALFGWAKICMEVRGLIDIAGAPATRKRRSDYGTTGVGKLGLPSSEQPTVEAVRERLQSSLSGLPDESAVGE